MKQSPARTVKQEAEVRHIPSVNTRNNNDPEFSLRVGIVGCGRVAAHHLRFIAKIPGVSIVGLTDQREESARSLAEEYQVTEVHDDLESMLDAAGPDVLHILTPPFEHYSQALMAIRRGVHVLIEKPVTLKAEEAEDLYRQASSSSVSLCPDFIQLFHPAFMKARAVIESGELGKVVYVESYLSQSLDIPELRESRRLHWSYQLPGGVLHNYLTHPLYMALQFVGTPQNIAVTPMARGVLPQGLTDHLDVRIDTAEASAHVVVSHAMQSQPTYFATVFCEKAVVWVNFDTSTVLVTGPSAMPRSLDRATSNFFQAARLTGSGLKNIADFLRGRLVPYQGLQELIPRFYASLGNMNRVPVSQDLTMAVVRAEEEIFSRAGKLHLNLDPRPARNGRSPKRQRVLITGAAGYVGRETARQLVQEGYAVRALVRPLNHIEPLEELGVEIVFGDVRDLECLTKVTEGIDIIVHAAAGLRGNAKHVLDSSIVGTQNVAEVAQRAQVNRVIYISSMSVYDFSKLRDGDVITENSPLDDHPEQRGAYSLGKRKAEELALSHLGDDRPSWTILRPSVVVGGSSDAVGPVGFFLGNRVICMSPPSKTLRLVHVEDVAQAICQLARNDETNGRVFVVSSPQKLLLGDYLDACLGAANPIRTPRVVYIPLWFAKLGVIAIMTLRKVTGKGPHINLNRLTTLYRNVGVSTSALKEATGWEPRTDLLDRLVEEIAAGPLKSHRPQ